MAASESSLDVLYFKKLTKLFGRKAFLIQGQKNKQTLMLNYFKTFKTSIGCLLFLYLTLKYIVGKGQMKDLMNISGRFSSHFWGFK